jgi:signal recognition particle subunit SRP19
MLINKGMEEKMRKQDKIIIWPSYFDSTKTRNHGRRVPKGMAIPSPKILEIKDVADKLHLEYEVMMEAAYPKTPWLKTGMLLANKSEAKEQMIKKIAKELMNIRSVSATK